MQAGKARARKRIAKAPRRIGRVEKPARERPAQAEKPTRVRAIALGELSQSLGYRIRRAQLWVFKNVGRQLVAFDISPAQFSVLCVIDANPGVNQLAIAHLLSIERAGLGRLVDHLKRRGLVRRTTSSINRRYYLLHLTEAGEALLGRLRPAVAVAEKGLAAKIGARPYKELQKALSIFLQDS
jgi:DNA-binding MarR family transcriptional regulator